MRATTKLRELITSKATIMLPGTFNALVARMIEKKGFDVVYCTGGGISASLLGMPDIGLLSLTEMSQYVGHIAKAVNIPVISDADTGFGNAINVMRTVHEFEKQGVAGIHIEDQVFAKRCGHLAGKEVISTEEMVGKISAAIAARQDPDFILIARCDAKSTEGMEGLIQRCRMYADAGADVIFPEALSTKEELIEFRKAVPNVPLFANMTEFGKTPFFTAEEWGKMGYQMIVYPVTTLRVAMKPVEQFLIELKATGTQKNWISKMQTREELYDVINYAHYTECENKYLPRGGIDPLLDSKKK